MAFGPEMEILGKVLVAALLGGIIGLERELHNKPAGLRTHALVCAAGALFVSLATLLVELYRDELQLGQSLRAEPVAVIEAIVVGISFLGAGVIIQHKEGQDVFNLTTAASILVVAAIGIAVALDAYFLAVGATLLALGIVWGLGILEQRILDTQVKKDKRIDKRW